MSPLRARFIGYRELKGFSSKTVRNYVQVVKQFTRHIGKSPVHMTRTDVENYLLHLKRVKKLEARTINLHFYGLGFMASAVKSKRFAAVLRFFNRMPPEIKEREHISVVDTIIKLLGFDPLKSAPVTTVACNGSP